MNEILDLCYERRETRTEWVKHPYDEAQVAVPTLHNDVRKNMRSTKENWTEESGVMPLRKE